MYRLDITPKIHIQKIHNICFSLRNINSINMTPNYHKFTPLHLNGEDNRRNDISGHGSVGSGGHDRVSSGGHDRVNSGGHNRDLVHLINLNL